MKSGTLQQSCLYTHFAGYKFSLFVCPKSKGFDDDGKGTHVSVFISLMKGDNDDNLKFPFKGCIVVSLLNSRQEPSHQRTRSVHLIVIFKESWTCYNR